MYGVGFRVWVDVEQLALLCRVWGFGRLKVQGVGVVMLLASLQLYVTYASIICQLHFVQPHFHRHDLALLRV